MPEDDEDELPSDPYDRAKAALRAAREARGLDPDADEDVPELIDEDRTPLGRAKAALERAAAAREASVGRRQLEREQRAREQLEQLKSGGGAPRATEPAEDEKPAAPGPKPRRL